MSSVRTAALATFFAGTALAAGLAQAQVYRIVGPDGKVTFTDRPPVDSRAAPAAGAAGGGGGTANLPSELRKASGQYPVTLYTGSGCGPCGEARAMLQRRGIPFSEKTISTEQDVAALQRISGSNNLPFATVGQQHLTGFSEVEWAQYLDAAGYPKTSQLPSGYRNPPAAPLVAVQQPAVPVAEQSGSGSGMVAVPSRTSPPPAPATDSAPANPAGIRF